MDTNIDRLIHFRVYKRGGGSTTDSNIRVKKSRALRIIRVENVEYREIFV